MGQSYSLKIFLHLLLPQFNSPQPFVHLNDDVLQISSHLEMAPSQHYDVPRTTIILEHESIHHSHIPLHHPHSFTDQLMFTVTQLQALHSFPLPHLLGFAPHR